MAGKSLALSFILGPSSFFVQFVVFEKIQGGNWKIGCTDRASLKPQRATLGYWWENPSHVDLGYPFIDLLHQFVSDCWGNPPSMTMWDISITAATATKANAMPSAVLLTQSDTHPVRERAVRIQAYWQCRLSDPALDGLAFPDEFVGFKLSRDDGSRLGRKGGSTGNLRTGDPTSATHQGKHEPAIVIADARGIHAKENAGMKFEIFAIGGQVNQPVGKFSI